MQEGRTSRTREPLSFRWRGRIKYQLPCRVEGRIFCFQSTPRSVNPCFLQSHLPPTLRPANTRIYFIMVSKIIFCDYGTIIACSFTYSTVAFQNHNYVNIPTVQQNVATMQQTVATVQQTVATVQQTVATLPQCNKLLPQCNKLLPQCNKLLPHYNKLLPQCNKLLPHYNKLLRQYVIKLTMSSLSN